MVKKAKGEKKDAIDRKRFGKSSKNESNRVEVKCKKDVYTKKDGKTKCTTGMVVGQTYYVSAETAKILEDKGLV